jgi:hypothetical protein
MNASRYRTPSGCRALRSTPRAQSRKGCRPRRSTSYISGVWPASPPPHSTLHGRAYHVFAFHLKRAGESRTQCDWRHFGRLAGFTNQKKERRLDNGLQPFVKLRCSEGRVYSRAAEFLREVEELKGEPLLRPEPRELARPWHTDAPVRPITSFQANSHYGRDLHRADLAWALHADNAVRAIREPSIGRSRHEGRAENGRVNRTLDPAPIGRRSISRRQCLSRG